MKQQLHTVYRNQQGDVIPGVTTIIDQLGWNKSALIGWAKKLVRQGLDPDRVRDQAAEIGALAHDLIHAQLTGRHSDTSVYAPVAVEHATTCLRAFHNWHARHYVDVVAAEVPLISEHHQYGGTADLIAQVDGIACVLDFKTSANVWPEHKIQLSAYGNAWNEQHPGQPVTAYHLLRLDKQTGAYVHHAYEDLSAAWDVFLQLRRLWALRPFLDACAGRQKGNSTQSVFR